MNFSRLAFACTFAALAAGCAATGGDHGATHTQRLTQPPEAAARCFARNAEDHSSALKSEVSATRGGGAHALIQVKNGVTYASADFRRAGSGSVAAITLMATTPRGQRDLLATLVKGC